MADGLPATADTAAEMDWDAAGRLLADAARGAAVEHVRVDHRRRDVAVAEQLLHRADVVAVLQ